MHSIVMLREIAPSSSFLVVLPQTVFIEGTGDLLQDDAMSRISVPSFLRLLLFVLLDISIVSILHRNAM
jgi:hypothetical protein